MKEIIKKHGVTIISAITIVVVCLIWWINGAEKEDAWLYIVSIAIVAIPAVDSISKRKK